jgi:Holliday junction resolvase RusA-like endonuclease
MKIIIPFKTPTINHLYWHRGSAKIMKSEAKELQKQIISIVGGLNSQSPLITPDTHLKVTTEIYEDWYYKNGDIAKKDVSNREKFLIDSVFKGLELDDKQIFEQTFKKIQSEEEKAIISIEVL